MKILRRIFAVAMLLLTVFAVGYFCYTCSRLNGEPVPYETLQKSAYKSKNGTILVFSDASIWYFTEDETYICEFETYEKTTLTVKTDKQSFHFRVIDQKTIYDVQEKEFLVRSGGG